MAYPWQLPAGPAQRPVPTAVISTQPAMQYRRSTMPVARTVGRRELIQPSICSQPAVRRTMPVDLHRAMAALPCRVIMPASSMATTGQAALPTQVSFSVPAVSSFAARVPATRSFIRSPCASPIMPPRASPFMPPRASPVVRTREVRLLRSCSPGQSQPQVSPITSPKLVDEEVTDNVNGKRETQASEMPVQLRIVSANLLSDDVFVKCWQADLKTRLKARGEDPTETVAELGAFLENCRSSWEWPARDSNFGQFCAQRICFDADIVCCQEVSDVDSLRAYFGSQDWDMFLTQKDPPSRDWNVVFVRRSILHSEQLASIQLGGRRPTQVVGLRHKDSGRQFNLISWHFPGGSDSLSQADSFVPELLDRAELKPASGLGQIPLIVVGDFNADFCRLKDFPHTTTLLKRGFVFGPPEDFQCTGGSFGAEAYGLFGKVIDGVGASEGCQIVDCEVFDNVSMLGLDDVLGWQSSGEVRFGQDGTAFSDHRAVRVDVII